MKAKWVHCPIKGCPRKAHTDEGLFYHLYEHHSKAEVIRALTRGSLLSYGYENLPKADLIKELLICEGRRRTG